jgi:uncharacterized protein (TIGR01777 family)
MIIGLTGASGFLGRHFTKLAKAAGHTVVGFSRRPADGQRDVAAFDFSGFDAVVHLAGENVLGLWTEGKKKRIRESRIEMTQQMVAAMRALPQPPKVLVSASGIAFYGDRGDELLDEKAAQGAGFLGEVVRDWEAAVAAAGDFARTVSVRLGMVLGSDGGGWPMQRKIFRLGLGGRLGSGQQWVPWIHVEDAVRLLLFAVEEAQVSGVVNGVAPGALRNVDFTKALATAVHRPALFPAPAFMLKMLPGGMGSIFLDSVRAEPRAVLNAGFEFRYTTFAEALAALV